MTLAELAADTTFIRRVAHPFALFAKGWVARTAEWPFDSRR